MDQHIETQYKIQQVRSSELQAVSHDGFIQAVETCSQETFVEQPIPENSQSLGEFNPRQAHAKKQPFIIGVAGGTASGKTTVCDIIQQRLNEQCVSLISQDSFYRNLTAEELHDVEHFNFDEPAAFDTDLLLQTMEKLKQGESVEIPVYDFATHKRLEGETVPVGSSDIIIVEGILVLHIEQIRSLMDMKIYVDTDDDIRLSRRIIRDIQKRGRNMESVITQYTQFVKPSFDKYVGPSRKHADIIIPWDRPEGANFVAIDLIVQHIKMKLQQPSILMHYHNLQIMPSNKQIKGMHTFIRNRESTKNDFVFYADRLNRLVVETGLGHLPFKQKWVQTPTGKRYEGVEFAKRICGVSVIRSGESMETALRACCKGIKIGKILVYRHRDHRKNTNRRMSLETYRLPRTPPPGVGGRSPPPANDTSRVASPSPSDMSNSPPVPPTYKTVPYQPYHDNAGAGTEATHVYEKLPKDIAERHVLLMDPILATGNSAVIAIQVLVEKGVRPDRIVFLTLVAAPEGIHLVSSKFPDVRIITSEVDERVDEQYQVVPGMGEFGDRYFCD